MKSDMFPEQAEFFLWHSIHVKDKFYLNFSSKKVGYQKLILSIFISKTLNYNEFVFDMYGVPQKKIQLVLGTCHFSQSVSVTRQKVTYVLI